MATLRCRSARDTVSCMPALCTTWEARVGGWVAGRGCILRQVNPILEHLCLPPFPFSYDMCHSYCMKKH